MSKLLGIYTIENTINLGDYMINGENVGTNMNIKIEESNIKIYNILKRTVDVCAAIVRDNNFMPTFASCFRCK